MHLAIKEAQKGEGLVSPNPLVGSVLVCDNEIIVKGYHGEVGKLHAERVVFEKISYFRHSERSKESPLYHSGLDPESLLEFEILKQVQDEKAMIEKSTLYITLEPCCHYGKTPPCTKAIIEFGIKKVVCAQVDPNPQVSGKGIKILRDAGIEVIVGVLEEEAQRQIRFFRYWIKNKKPYFVAKLAISADGFYAKSCHHEPVEGSSSRHSERSEESLPCHPRQGGDPSPPDELIKNNNITWISHPNTRKKTRAMRKQYDAIMIGKKTLLADSPHLGTSHPLCHPELVSGSLPYRDPTRIILCQTTDFSMKNLQAFRDENVIVASLYNPRHSERSEESSVCHSDLSPEGNPSHLCHPELVEGSLFYKNLNDLQKKLFELGFQSILLEGGGELMQLFLEEKMINEIFIVRSKNIFLKEGQKAPEIPKHFQPFKQEDLGEDVLEWWDSRLPHF